MDDGGLNYKVFRRSGRQFITILLCKGMLTMTMVAAPIRFWTCDLAKAYSMELEYRNRACRNR